MRCVNVLIIVIVRPVLARVRCVVAPEYFWHSLDGKHSCGLSERVVELFWWVRSECDRTGVLWDGVGITEVHEECVAAPPEPI